MKLPMRPKPSPGGTSERTRSERKLGWMLCAPAVAAMLLVTAYPIGYAIVLSLQRNARVNFRELAAEVGLSPNATADRVQTDQVGVERAYTGSERIALALHLAAHAAEVETLAFDLARHGGTIDRAGDDAAELHAGDKDEAAREEHAQGGGQQYFRLPEVELADTPGTARHNLQIHSGADPLRGRRACTQAPPEGRSCVTHLFRRISRELTPQLSADCSSTAAGGGPVRLRGGRL